MDLGQQLLQAALASHLLQPRCTRPQERPGAAPQHGHQHQRHCLSCGTAWAQRPDSPRGMPVCHHCPQRACTSSAHPYHPAEGLAWPTAISHQGQPSPAQLTAVSHCEGPRSGPAPAFLLGKTPAASPACRHIALSEGPSACGHTHSRKIPQPAQPVATFLPQRSLWPPSPFSRPNLRPHLPLRAGPTGCQAAALFPPSEKAPPGPNLPPRPPLREGPTGVQPVAVSLPEGTPRSPAQGRPSPRPAAASSQPRKLTHGRHSDGDVFPVRRTL